MISPTSSSSELKGEKFFRTVGGTKKSAKLYANYIREELKFDSITVFYVKKSGYSKVLKNDFKESFREKGSIMKEINIETDINIKEEIDTAFINIKEEIDTAFKKGDKALLIISNVKTNSVAIAISRENLKRPEKQRMILIAAMSLSEEETIERGGDAVEGMILVRPRIAPKSYHKKIMEQWQLKNEINWRHTSSYDATQAFIKAIKQYFAKDRNQFKSFSHREIRLGILSELSDSNFYLEKNETAGFGLKWDKSDRSNINQKYCVVEIKKGEFKEKFCEE